MCEKARLVARCSPTLDQDGFFLATTTATSAAAASAAAGVLNSNSNSSEGFVDVVVHDTQKGVLRTNCVDCLDRTNVAQVIMELTLV